VIIQTLQERTFDLESIFPDGSACQETLAKLRTMLDDLDYFRGRLTISGRTLLDGLERFAEFDIQLYQATLYAFLRYDQNVDDGEAKSLRAFGQEVESEYLARAAWKDKELGELNTEAFRQLQDEEPRLEIWKQAYQEANRKNIHRGSADTEKAIAELGTVTTMNAQLRRTLFRDHSYPDFIGKRGELQSLARDDLYTHFNDDDARVRRAAWNAYNSVRWQYRHTLASMLNVFIKCKSAEAKLRSYGSSLEAALDNAQLDLEVFDQTLLTCREHPQIWHRYFEVRRRMLNLEHLTTIDTNYIPEAQISSIPYEQAVDLIVSALKPLGEDYTDALYRGLTTERWVDVYPRTNKATNEYSWTTTGCKPFVMLQYRGNLQSLSSLAHESGHAMHSLYTYRTQPHQYATYGQTAAEVAANFHQAMLFSYLSENHPDPKLRRAILLEELRLSMFYLMRMPLNAVFERELYEIVENNDILDADRITERYATLERESFGQAAIVKPDDLVWAEQGILYNHFYSFQYALGLAGGQAIAQRVRSGQEGAADDYLRFISTGISVPQLESIRFAGIDFRSPEPIQIALDRVSRNIDLLEKMDLEKHKDQPFVG
jgi:oligoendopeptidase F